MGERAWFESVNTPWLKLNYLSGSIPKSSVTQLEKKTLCTSLPPGIYSPRLHQALLNEEERRSASSVCSPRLPFPDKKKSKVSNDGRRSLQKNLLRKTAAETKEIWKNAARIQPVEASEVDGIATFMTTCTRTLEDEEEQDRLVEAELLQRKSSLPLHLGHSKAKEATLADGNSYSVYRFKSKLLQLRDRSHEGKLGSANDGRLEEEEEERLPSYVYNDENLSRVLRDFSTWHKGAECVANEKRNIPTRKLQQLEVLALNDHSTLSPQLLSAVVSTSSRSLKVLELASCTLDGSLARSIGECTQLQTLDLSYSTNLKSVNFVRTLADLKVLRLSGCKEAVTDSALAEWITCAPGLEVLHIGNCTRLTNAGLYAMSSRLQSLKEVDVSDFKELEDQGLASLCFANPSLDYINFSRCGSTLTDEGAAIALASLPKLRHLDSSGNVHVGHQMLVKPKHRCLEYLSVSRSQCISDETLFALMKNQGSSRLRIIDLRACPSITPAGVEALLRASASLKVAELESITAVKKDDFLKWKRDFPHVATKGFYDFPDAKTGLPTFRVLPTATKKRR